MSDNAKLKELAEALKRAIEQAEHKPGEWAGTAQSMGGICCPGVPFQIGKPWAKEEPWASFSYKRDSWLAVAAVNALPRLLGLIAEIERLRDSDQESTELCDTLSVLLGSVAVAVRGPEQPKSRHGFHDIPSRVKTVVAERDQLRAEIAGLRTGYEAYERVNAELKAEVEGLRATADLQKLLPEVSDALEELELHGLHSDQGYRKLKDWHRKVGLAYRVIQGPMFGAEHGELVSQNTWLRSVVEHYAQQHAPLEPIPDMEGWSARLPGYDLPSLLRDAERYRRVRDIACRVRAYVGFHLVVQLPSPTGSSFCAAKAFDEAIDAVLGQGEQS